MYTKGAGSNIGRFDHSIGIPLNWLLFAKATKSWPTLTGCAFTSRRIGVGVVLSGSKWLSCVLPGVLPETRDHPLPRML